MKYDVDYFINKFSAIPEELWCLFSFIKGNGARCANGHCGINSLYMASIKINSEAAQLREVMGVLFLTDISGLELYDSILYENYSLKAAFINNGETREYQQPTPKLRILAALHDIKQSYKKAPVKDETKVIYRVVEVDSKVKALTKQDIILS